MGPGRKPSNFDLEDPNYLKASDYVPFIAYALGVTDPTCGQLFINSLQLRGGSEGVEGIVHDRLVRLIGLLAPLLAEDSRPDDAS